MDRVKFHPNTAVIACLPMQGIITMHMWPNLARVHWSRCCRDNSIPLQPAAHPHTVPEESGTILAQLHIWLQMCIWHRACAL